MSDMRQWMTEERETLLRSRLEAHGCPKPSDAGLRCADLVERLVGGLHHVYGSKGADGVDWTGSFVKVIVSPGMATFDWSAMTRAVLLAHELSIRVEITNAGRYEALLLHPRLADDGTGEADMMTHHPTVDRMVALWDGQPWVKELRALKAAWKAVP
jgi:hypothetical protein